MVRNLLILSLKVALHVDDAIYFVCFACMQHACDPTNATIFSFERMPTSTSLFPFCSLHGRCDDLFSIATTMHNHTPRQPTAPSSSWLCQPKDSKAMPRKATLRCYAIIVQTIEKFLVSTWKYP
jgi:hypothetical protein